MGQSKFSGDLNNKLRHNIEAIMGAAGAPDLIVLEEANSGTFKALKEINFEPYGYDKMLAVPYSKTNPWAYFVLIWKERTLQFKDLYTEPLNAELTSLTGSTKDNYNKLKEKISKKLPNLEYQSVIKVDFVFKGKRISVYPVHFSNIWPALVELYYAQAKEGSSLDIAAKLSAKAFALKELIAGPYNPHAALVKNFVNRVSELSPADPNNENVLVIGDFNAFPWLLGAKRLAGMVAASSDKSFACKYMEDHFSTLYPAWGKMSSFPTSTYREVKPETSEDVLIDLAYHRGAFWRVGRSEVLPLVGSDHYPVYYKILHNP